MKGETPGTGETSEKTEETDSWKREMRALDRIGPMDDKLVAGLFVR